MKTGAWLAVVAGVAWAGLIRADTVELKGGDRLTGKVQGISATGVSLATTYAGTLTIDRAAVARIVTETAVAAARHGYVSRPPDDKQKLDTTYFTRTKFSW
jgi:hypothetical protein